MNKTIVIYKSKYGSTKKYAEWIAQSLGCTAVDVKSAKHINEYDTVIYGGGLYAGGVNGIDFLISNFGKIKGKRIIIFTCGIADPKNEKNLQTIRSGLQKKLPDELYEKAEFFHLRGAMDYSKLSLIHRAMMAMLRKMILKSGVKSEEDRQILETYGKAVDFTDKAAAEPVIISASEKS